MHHRNIFRSSKVFGNLWKSLDTFGNFRKFLENVQERLSALRNNFRKSSEIFGKSSKTPSSVCLYNKKNITCQLEDMNFMSSWQEQYSCHSNIKFISSRHRVISSMSMHISIQLYYQLCNPSSLSRNKFHVFL